MNDVKHIRAAARRLARASSTCFCAANVAHNCTWLKAGKVAKRGARLSIELTEVAFTLSSMSKKLEALSKTVKP